MNPEAAMPTAESPDENVETEPVDLAPEPPVEIQQETPVSEAVLMTQCLGST